MALFMQSGIRLASTLMMALPLLACQSEDASAPTSARIEASAMSASHNGDPAAERQVRKWADQGLPVAQRELALLYKSRTARRNDAMQLFEKAARAGDREAAFELAEMYRNAGASLGAPTQAARAWPWYQLAAGHRHPKAALMLGLLAANGEGVARDPVEAAKWLTLSSELGNPHAMFLLYNAHQQGLGVPRDMAKARQWLEQSAEHEYPPALQELAMTVEAGDAITPKDTLRASHLMKEATEHRHNNWNRY